ncbi:hypothetical protein FrEUN1fDRAFT_6243 [Parafrankia sp. EUN1f]|nr:hypothetical protein FrEUN1fDRAFT_6243 [Parafrankia sp. EUN1f]
MTTEPAIEPLTVQEFVSALLSTVEKEDNADGVDA